MTIVVAVVVEMVAGTMIIKTIATIAVKVSAMVIRLTTMETAGIIEAIANRTDPACCC